MKDMPLFKNSSVKIETSFKSSSNIVLYYGDVEKFLKTIPDDSITLVITSPPYNLGKSYEKRYSIAEYLETQKKVIKQIYRTLRNDGSICWQIGNYVKNGEIYPLDIFYYNIFKELGMFLRNRIIWHFGHGLHASKRFSGRYEVMLWFTKSDNYIFNLDAIRIPSKYPGKCHFKGPNKGKPSGNPKGKNPSDVWKIIAEEWENAFWEFPNVKANHPEKTAHPCQFPVELVERCVHALTNANDWVLDPYAGAGSSLIGAVKNNRRAVGSDNKFEYINIAHDRINSFFTGELKLRSVGTSVHKPTGREKISQYPIEWGTGEDLQKGE